MTPSAILSQLASYGVELFIDGDRLRYRATSGAYTPELRALVAEHRAAIVTHLAGGAAPAAVERCVSHIDPADWLDSPAPGRKGWIRTTCRRCGAFVGYRPES